MTNEMKERLLATAKEARKNAYAPYSGFAVGVALLAEDGRIFSGCNVENAAYSPTLCAERVAIGTAVAAGARRFTAVCVVGGHGDGEEDCSPCGVCRQSLAEFSDGEMAVLFRHGGQLSEMPLSSLLPFCFSL